MTSKANQGYKREKFLAAALGMNPRPFSGSRWQSGKEDIYDELRLGQIKSTRKKTLSILVEDIWALLSHTNEVQMPLFVLDFIEPKIDGVELPDITFVAIPLEDFKKIFAVYHMITEDKNTKIF